MNAASLVEAEYRRLCRQHHAAAMPDAVAIEAIAAAAHGHFPQWLDAAFANAVPNRLTAILDSDTVTASAGGNDSTAAPPANAINALMPWRKGPFNLLGESIDSEWRSDFKYRRLLDLGFNVQDKTVLDVGTGNGYFLYRLLGSGASIACGLDPSWHNFAQFLFLQRYLQQERAIYLPATLDSAVLSGFDTAVSMGVLYHRRDPLAFLSQLRGTIKTGGQIVIETLVIDGGENDVYLPDGRYAGMRNVWFLPSIKALCKWLQRIGFAVLEAGNAVPTLSSEQRRTRHMQSYSLAEFMREHGNQPPPKRAIIIAKKC